MNNDNDEEIRVNQESEHLVCRLLKSQGHQLDGRNNKIMHLKDLSNQKMANKMGSRLINGLDNQDCDLIMECVDEDPSEAQMDAYNRHMTQYKETSNNVDLLLRVGVIDVTERGTDYIAIEFKENMNMVNGTKVRAPLQNSSGPRPMGPVQTSSALVLQNSGVVQSTANTYQLVMDSRALGLYVNSNPTPATTSVPLMASVTSQTPRASPVLAPTIPSNVAIRSKATAIRTPQPRAALPASLNVPSQVPLPRVQPPRITAPISTPPALAPISPVHGIPTTTLTGNRTTPVNIKPSTTKGVKANEASSVGGIGPSKGGPNKASATVVDLTDDDGRSKTADSKEVMFNKLSGKTYPSLVVVARPMLRVKEVTQAQIAAERSTLDSKMKAVLMGTPTKFTEWLIQQGLVRSEQYCSIHVNPNMTPIKLKLGMYSDITKFPYSGGYVWISECCPQRFVSVFSGSIFEGAPHAPTLLVKLLYHWSCQTSVNNITSWVKVEGLYVKSFFTNIRSVCTAAVHEKFGKLGGPKKRVELGVISLGTTSQDGSMRQVKVEVLGVYDPESKLMKLRAVEPLLDGERNYKRRFVKILEPLEEWVHKDSIILTDYTVDKGTLIQMGYPNVYQVSANEASSSNKYSNTAIMDYLRRYVPRMFQNTLSLLSRQIIQQFLDELCWRERWGFIPARAFETMIAHLAEQTKLDSGDTLMTRLNKIASNPFKNWSYKNWQSNCAPSATPPVTRFIVGSNEPITNPPPASLPSIDNLPPSLKAGEAMSSTTTTVPGVKRRKGKGSTAAEPELKKRALPPSSSKLRPLDSYYYGCIPGDLQILNQQKNFELNVKCAICSITIKDNLRMMRHLIGHAYNEGSYSFSDSSPQCRYCIKDFSSDIALQSHVEEAHEKVSLVCLICRENNRDRTTLILHMHNNHLEQELPYQCDVCQFRCSQHNKLIDHFYQEHENTDKLQCPFCLKIVNLHNVEGRKITQNQYFFLRHIQKHQRKSLARKCNKCVLWFVHKDLIKGHLIKNHCSCKDLPELERAHVDGLDAVMMPTPMESNVTTQKNPASKLKNTLMNHFTMNSFSGLQMCGVKEGTTCSECEGDILQEDHFPGFLSCLKCRFSTCCNKAMNEHFIIYHDRPQSKPHFNVGKSIILEKPLYCVCGFYSKSGNKLAYHLAECKRKSAYPSPERAAQCTLQGQSASFPPLVTLDEEDAQDNEGKWLRAFTQPRISDNLESTEKTAVATSGSRDPPSMLNVLGLVRKPSIDESSCDKLHSEGEQSNDVLDDGEN